jgi:hypothetical protein
MVGITVEEKQTIERMLTRWSAALKLEISCDVADDTLYGVGI